MLQQSRFSLVQWATVFGPGAAIGFLPEDAGFDYLRRLDDLLQPFRVGGRACRRDNDNFRLSWSPTAETSMDKFLVLYRAPNSVIDEWMKKPEQERKPEEAKMMEAWKKWMSANGSKLTDKGAGAGKPKVVSSSGVKDGRNDIMMYQIVQANSADEAAKMFVDHPHFGIPQATVEVMPLKAMEG